MHFYAANEIESGGGSEVPSVSGLPTHWNLIP